MENLNKSRSLLRSPVSPPESPSLPSVSTEGKIKVDKLIGQVDSIIVSDELSAGDQQLYQTWFQEASDLETLKYGIQRLHYYWLSNKSSVVKAAIFLCANWMAEVGELKLRNSILLILQEDFEKRQAMQAKSPDKFLNAAEFLVEIFSRIRITTLPLSFLVSPVFEYLEDLLTGDESEIELFAHLVVRVAPTVLELQDVQNSSLISFNPIQNVFAKVRSTLMSRNLSSQSRLWLLLIMDVSSSGDFKVPSSSLRSFYQEKDHLGASADSLLKTLETLNSVGGQNSTPKLGSVADISVNHQISSMKLSEPKNQETTNKMPSSGFKKRSPGKTEDLDKRENFRSAFNLDNKGSKGKSYWLHDDRFDRDEAYSSDKKSEGLTKPRASQGNWRQSSMPKDGKDKTPKASQGNWRQPQSSTHGSREITNARPAAIPNVLELAGHVEEESWE